MARSHSGVSRSLSTTVTPGGPRRASSAPVAAASRVGPPASSVDRWRNSAGAPVRPVNRGAGRSKGNVCTLTGSRRTRATNPRAAASRTACTSFPSDAIDPDVSTSSRTWTSSSASNRRMRSTSSRAYRP